LSSNSKLTHIDKNLNFNLNLNHKGFTAQEKTDMVLIYGEAHGHSELARQIYGERFPQKILPNVRTFVNIVQHLRDFGLFQMNKRNHWHQRQDRILVPEEEILHENEKQPRTSTWRLANHLGVSQFVSLAATSKRPSTKSSKQRHSESSSAFLDTPCGSLRCER
jgi:hypothetical protein